MKNVTYINASAGSGKTYTLTHLLADLIGKGKVKPEQVIMTTFTVKAANEMKEEAKKVLYKKGLFDEASRLDQAMIGTIHSIANAVIKKYWFFLGLAPDMEVMTEDETNFYISQSLADVPTKEELKILHAFCEEFDVKFAYGSGKYGVNYDFWKEALVCVINYTTNYEVQGYGRSIDESLEFIGQFVNKDVAPNCSGEELLEIIDAQIQFANGQRKSKKKEDTIAGLGKLKRGVNNPSIAWYKEFDKLLNAWNDCADKAKDIRSKIANRWRWPLVYEKQKKYIELLFALAERWRENYNTYKKEKNVLDYNDMEKYMFDILQKEELSEEVGRSYRYLFVDEYQDCSPIQVKIFDRLSNLMEHSYWVGDYKQAIYGFRGSDITLTKSVVDTIAAKEKAGQDGCEMAKPLDTSYRSLPDIVEVCNKVFKETFKGVLPEKNITLKQSRNNDENLKSLRYWNLKDAEGSNLARHIAHMIQTGVKPSDIAVLARDNDSLNALAATLKTEFGIPSSKENVSFSEMKVQPLVMALLALVASQNDALAKAQIAYLTEQGYSTSSILDEKIELDKKKEKGFLEKVPLVELLLKLRPMLTQQSVYALVETMIIEMDLYNEVKKLGGGSESMTCLDLVKNKAKEYEQHCMQMNLSATVVGFMDYLNVMDPTGAGDVNGVLLCTYHSSKGLQWKYVILTSLNNNVGDMKKCVKNNIYGIHPRYVEQPSIDNPYPEVYIHVVPFIFGVGKTNVPDDFIQQIKGTTLYQQVMLNSLSEENRLMYVGMTRPRDVLIMALEKGNSLQWLSDIGLEKVNHDGSDDLLGVGCKFTNDTLTQDQANGLEGYRYDAENSTKESQRVPYQQKSCEEDRKFVSPSSVKGMGKVEANYDISKRLPLGALSNGKTMADVGDCIHQIFCGIEQHIVDEQYYINLIHSYGLENCLKDIQAIKDTWNHLVAWLTQNYGAAKKVYHERPFLNLKDGQVFTGSIDLVWQTERGDVLIDYKTCPLGHDHILKQDDDFYAGKYAGQLNAYIAALTAAGETVIEKFIFYPVSGMLCKIE